MKKKSDIDELKKEMLSVKDALQKIRDFAEKKDSVSFFLFFFFFSFLPFFFKGMYKHSESV
jgi:hypothetical protein